MTYIPPGITYPEIQKIANERDQLKARVDELSRAYAGAGLAIEELTDERDRYLEALKNLRDNIRITSSTVCPNPYLESWLVVIAEALEPTK